MRVLEKEAVREGARLRSFRSRLEAGLCVQLCVRVCVPATVRERVGGAPELLRCHVCALCVLCVSGVVALCALCECGLAELLRCHVCALCVVCVSGLVAVVPEREALPHTRASALPESKCDALAPLV